MSENVEQSSKPKGAYLGAALGQRANRHREEGDPRLSTSSSIDNCQALAHHQRHDIVNKHAGQTTYID
jgi:hypothetical protein